MAYAFWIEAALLILAPCAAFAVPVAPTPAPARSVAPPADVKALTAAAAQDWQQSDYPDALRIWAMLAHAGNADAWYDIAQAYRLGRGVEANLPVAIGAYKKALALGHPLALEQLGLALYALPDRRAESYPYLERAASAGSARAHFALGIARMRGEDLPRDLALAKLHLDLALAGGVDEARQPLVFVRLDMSPQDRERAMTIALTSGRGFASAAAAPGQQSKVE